jgi:hypothetical protein
MLAMYQILKRDNRQYTSCEAVVRDWIRANADLNLKKEFFNKVSLVLLRDRFAVMKNYSFLKLM